MDNHFNLGAWGRRTSLEALAYAFPATKSRRGLVHPRQKGLSDRVCPSRNSTTFLLGPTLMDSHESLIDPHESSSVRPSESRLDDYLKAHNISSDGLERWESLPSLVRRRCNSPIWSPAGRRGKCESTRYIKGRNVDYESISTWPSRTHANLSSIET